MRKAMAILGIPVGEFLFLRVLLHSGLGIRIGYWGMTDYDWLFPSAIAFFILMFAFQRTTPLELKLSRPMLFANTALLVTFILFSASFADALTDGNLLARVIWFAWAALTLGSSLFLFVSPKYFYCHADRVLLIPFFLLAGSKVIGRHFFSFLWQPIADLTGLVAYRVAHLFSSDVAQNIHVTGAGERFTPLNHPLFTVAIGIGCGGLEGIFFLLFALVLLYFVDRRKFTPTQWSLIAGIGVLYMYGLNIARIVVFYGISITAIKAAGAEAGVRAAIALFHSSIGWVMYSIGLVVFYGFMDKVAAISDQPLLARKAKQDV